MSTLGPRVPLDAPPFVPPILSIIQSLPGPGAEELARLRQGRPADAGESWAFGGEFRSIVCTWGATVFDFCDEGSVFAPGELSDLVDVNAFGTMVEDRCSTFGFTVAQYRERALAKHAVQSSFLIAHEFWTGDLIPGNFHLAAGASVVDITPGTPPKPQDALGRLDQAINEALMGAMGAIHMPINLLHDAAVANGVRWVGDPTGTQIRAYTYGGTLIVADAGYPGTGPTGQSDPQLMWMYATAMPKLYQSEAEVYPPAELADTDWMRQATSRQGDNSQNPPLPPNTVVARAQAAAMVIVDPCALIGIEATRAGVN